MLCFILSLHLLPDKNPQFVDQHHYRAKLWNVTISMLWHVGFAGDMNMCYLKNRYYVLTLYIAASILQSFK